MRQQHPYLITPYRAFLARSLSVQPAYFRISSIRMSFLGGPECSTAGNPLTQFTKHVQNDNTLQRDRLVGRGPGGVEESMRSRVAPNGSDQVRDSTSPCELTDMARCSTTSCNSRALLPNHLRWRTYDTTSHRRSLGERRRLDGQQSSTLVRQPGWKQAFRRWGPRGQLVSILKNTPNTSTQVSRAPIRHLLLSIRLLHT